MKIKNTKFGVSNLIRINLPNSKSRIIQKNNGEIYCAVYSGLAGLFNKEIEKTALFGKALCDKVKKKFNNEGFFTSDELPRYGISKEDVQIIFRNTKAKKEDLIIFFAYDKENSEKVNNFVEKELKK